MNGVSKMPERSHSIFLLASPKDELTPTGKKARIHKTYVHRLVKQFQRIAKIEPYVVSADFRFADVCNLFVPVRKFTGISDLILATTSCWQGHLIFLLAGHKYENRMISSMFYPSNIQSVTFLEAILPDSHPLVGITVHKNACHSFRDMVDMAEDKTANSLDGIYKAFDTYREFVDQEYDIRLVLREAALHQDTSE